MADVTDEDRERANDIIARVDGRGPIERVAEALAAERDRVDVRWQERLGFDRRCGHHDRDESPSLCCRICVLLNADETEMLFSEAQGKIDCLSALLGSARRVLWTLIHGGETVTGNDRKAKKLIAAIDAALGEKP